MLTISRIFGRSSGCTFRKRAMLVRGPTGINVTGSGLAASVSAMRRSAPPGRSLVFGSGRFTLPIPFSPCTFFAVRASPTRGALSPLATGMSERPASSRSFSAFVTPSSSSTFPKTTVTARTSSSGERTARRMARASSIPGSTSRITGFGAAEAPAEKTRQRKTRTPIIGPDGRL
jgi:hypothetical protein